GPRARGAPLRFCGAGFVPACNAGSGRPPADPSSAFVPLGGADLDEILCHEELRTVAPDNTVCLAGVRLQIAKQRGRRTCAGLQVVIRRYLQGTHAIWWGTRCLGRYSPTGQPLACAVA